MGPSWLPLCKAMQRYCEAYFAAIENWAKYEDRSLLVNRLLLLESACELFKLYSEKPNTYVFEIVCANNSAPLLHEVFPSAGKNFVIGGDVQVYTAVKDRVPDNLFSKAGIYFQNSLLKALAGWNATVLAASNLESRKSLILSVEKLFRLAQSAGEGHFTITETIVDGVETEGEAQTFTPPVLSETGRNFYDFLIEYEEDRKKTTKKRSSEGQSSSSAATQSHKRSKNTNGSRNKKISEFRNDETGWISKHPTIGTEVAAYFPPVATEGVPRKLFTGVVVKYLPATNADADDHLYHILWEDGDEQDYDDKDLELGIKTFDQMNGWTSNHTSVGTKVAASFPVANTKKGQAPQFKVFKGVVMKYAPATDTEPLELYHIVWEDGDEQDYDEKDLQRGIQLYHETFENSKSAAASAGRHRKNIGSDAAAVNLSDTTTSGVSSSGEDSHSAKKVEEVEVVPNSSSKRIRTPSAAAVEAVVASEEESSPHKSKRGRPTKQEVINVDVDEDEPLWIANHATIGTKVAAYFPCSADDPDGVVVPSSKGKKSTKKMKPFAGVVSKYAGPSAMDEADQLYHIVWEDGDEEDYFQTEFEEGKELYYNLYGWKAKK